MPVATRVVDTGSGYIGTDVPTKIGRSLGLVAEREAQPA